MHLTQPPISLALIGLGVAGKAREKALAGLPAFRLAGVVSRRPGIGTHTLEEILADPTVEAVAVSTESTDHPQTVSRCLRAEKHVLCDYPLAFVEKEARDLFALARHQGRILHVEHIALLSSEHQKLKTDLKEQGSLVKGEYLFQGGWNPKLGDIHFTGPPPFLAVSRLVQVADLFGPFKMTEFRFEKGPKGFSLHLHLQFSQGGTLGFTEERTEGLPRRRTLLAQMEKGQVHWKAPSLGGGLFGRDLVWFGERVRAGKGCYYDEEMMLSIIGYLEEVCRSKGRTLIV